MAEMTIIQHQQVFRCSEPTQIHSIPDVNLGNTHFNWLQRAPLQMPLYPSLILPYTSQWFRSRLTELPYCVRNSTLMIDI